MFCEVQIALPSYSATPMLPVPTYAMSASFISILLSSFKSRIISEQMSAFSSLYSRISKCRLL